MQEEQTVSLVEVQLAVANWKEKQVEHDWHDPLPVEEKVSAGQAWQTLLTLRPENE